MVHTYTITPKEELPYHGKDVQYIKSEEPQKDEDSSTQFGHVARTQIGFEYGNYRGCYRAHRRI